MLKETAGLTLAGAALAGGLARSTVDAAQAGKAVRQGRIRQSIVHWCFEVAGGKWTVEETCVIANQLGVPSIELVAVEHFPTLKKYGLTSAIGQIDMDPDPPFLKGFNNPDYWPRVMKTTRETIDAAAAFGVPNVICFTGYSARNPDDPQSPKLSREEGADNCVAGFKQLMKQAEQQRVTLCLEMLNTRDDTHPMKGHPGYQGDHTDYCIDIIKRVGSERLKLLFDVYHVQVMDGDIIRRLRENKEYIGHVHTAGNPGRGPLDDQQELYYPPIMKTLLEIGYEGYVGQEFIPLGDGNAALASLTQAVQLCDV